MPLSYAEATRWLSEIGANIAGIVPSADWQEYLPPAAAALAHQRILIFGAGGPDFIHRYQTHARTHGECEHWLADYAQDSYAAGTDGDLAGYLNPYRAGLSFPFQRVAMAAGLGVRGLNHVVLHRDWGPWFSLLGALVLTEEVPITTPDAWDPCTGCPAPCLRACPGSAVTRAGFDGHRCIETKLSGGPCLHACLARHACVLRADLRAEMIALEASRPRDDAQTLALLQSLRESAPARATAAAAHAPLEVVGAVIRNQQGEVL